MKKKVEVIRTECQLPHYLPCEQSEAQNCEGAAQLTQWVNLTAESVSPSCALSPGIFLHGDQARCSVFRRGGGDNVSGSLIQFINQQTSCKSLQILRPQTSRKQTYVKTPPGDFVAHLYLGISG